MDSLWRRLRVAIIHTQSIVPKRYCKCRRTLDVVHQEAPCCLWRQNLVRRQKGRCWPEDQPQLAFRGYGYLRVRHDQHQRVPLGTSEAHDWFVSRLLRAARELRCRSNWGELSPVLSHSFCCCRLLSCQRLFIRALEFIPTECSELYACVVAAPAVDGLLLKLFGGVNCSG